MKKKIKIFIALFLTSLATLLWPSGFIEETLPIGRKVWCSGTSGKSYCSTQQIHLSFHTKTAIPVAFVVATSATTGHEQLQLSSCMTHWDTKQFATEFVTVLTNSLIIHVPMNQTHPDRILVMLCLNTKLNTCNTIAFPHTLVLCWLPKLLIQS